MRIAILLVLAGCPAAAEYPVPPETDILDGEGTEWTWGVPVCSVIVANDAVVTEHARDQRGQVVLVKREHESAPIAIRRGYDRDGRLLIEDDGGTILRYRYEGTRITETRSWTSPRETLTTWIYNADGKLARRTDGRLTEEWSRAGGQLVRYFVADSRGASEQEWSYDEQGHAIRFRVRGWTNGAWGTWSTRDFTWENDRVIRVTAGDWVDLYTWDDAARLTEMTLLRPDLEPNRHLYEYGPAGVVGYQYVYGEQLGEEAIVERSQRRTVVTFTSASSRRITTIDDSCENMPPLREADPFGLPPTIAGLPTEP
jgi:YD repeat-containing protein